MYGIWEAINHETDLFTPLQELVQTNVLLLTAKRKNTHIRFDTKEKNNEL